MQDEEREHKEKYKNEKLLSLFPKTLSYYFEKIFQGIHSPNDKEVGRTHLDIVEKIIVDFKDKLNNRGLLSAYDTVKYEIEEIAYPIDRLKAYFANASDNKLNDKDAHIFAYFIKDKLKGLKQIAEEIDKDYEIK